MDSWHLGFMAPEQFRCGSTYGFMAPEQFRCGSTYGFIAPMDSWHLWNHGFCIAAAKEQQGVHALELVKGRVDEMGVGVGLGHWCRK